MQGALKLLMGMQPGCLFFIFRVYSIPYVYLQVYQSVSLNWQVRDVESFCLQNSTRVQDTFVFRLQGDHMALLALVEPGNTL